MNNRNNSKGKKDFDQKLLDLARVTRVVRGGRRFRFRATVVVGNKKGKVGIGIAKGADVSDAINKAFNQGKKRLVDVKVNKEGTIAHAIRAKYKSAEVLLRPAKKGRGIVVGGAVRLVVELAGITDLTAKILRRGSKIANAMAALKGLTQIKERPVREEESKEIPEITSKN
jgi:small subunit ribosomal protein S5